MTRRSPVLEALAQRYEESTQGRTGVASRDFGVRFSELLASAKCESGDAYANALTDLAEAEGLGALEIERDRRSRDAQRVRLPLACEAALFERIGRVPPARERAAWAALFSEAVAGCV